MEQDAGKKIRVSIMLCTFNRADLLPFAINSVLAQTFVDWELLVLDDASTDNTATVVRPYLNDKRIRYIEHAKNLGIAKNRNFGLKEAKGEYVAVLDSDDVWLEPKKLEQQINFLDTHPEYVLVGTEMIIIDNKGNTLRKVHYPLENAAIRQSFLIRNQIAQSSVMYKKNAARRAGGYDETLAIWEDWDLWLKLGAIGNVANLPIFSLGYSEHGKNISNENEKKGIEASQKIISRYRNVYPNYWLGWIKLRLKLLLLILHLQ
jgi:glycosyltransferase involved in cell wall biosynthesis